MLSQNSSETSARPSRPDNSWVYDALATLDVVSAVYSIVLGGIALTCNPLSFIVLSRKAFQKSNLSVTLRCLTVSDSIALTLIAIRYSATKLYQINILANDGFCSFYFYAINVCLYTSTWILVVVSAERVVAIVKPHSVQIICSRNNAKIIMLVVIGVWLGSLVFYPIYHMDVSVWSGNMTYDYHCVFDATSWLMIDLVTWFDNLFFAFIPVVFLIVSSVMIVIGLKSSQKKLKSLGKPKTEYVEGSKDGSAKDAKKSSKESAMTRTILAINISFIVCNFPFCVYVVLPNGVMSQAEDPVYSYYIQRFSTNILLLLVYTNNALNFAMYFATGSKFRKELYAMFHEIMGKK